MPGEKSAGKRFGIVHMPILCYDLERDVGERFALPRRR